MSVSSTGVNRTVSFNTPLKNERGVRDVLKAMPNFIQTLGARTTGGAVPEIIGPRHATMIPIGGGLPRHRRLTAELFVLAIHEDGEVVVSEPRYHIHGYGATLEEAETDFRQVLVDSYELLQEDREVLDPYLQGQLAYLQSIITSA
jgi:hypothetical protein